MDRTCSGLMYTSVPIQIAMVRNARGGVSVAIFGLQGNARKSSTFACGEALWTASNENVGRLEITMNNAVKVGVLNRIAHLHRTSSKESFGRRSLGSHISSRIVGPSTHSIEIYGEYTAGPS